MQLHWPKGLNAEVFLRDYWQQRPLLLRQALPGFESPLSVDELAGLAMDEDLPSRLVWEYARDGQAPWRCEHGPFSEAVLSQLPDQGWSLLVSDIDKQLPDFQGYLLPFRFIPDWRLDDLMISTAPDGGSVGPHKDEYDVFLLQASGQRAWSIQYRSPDHYIDGLDLKILPDFVADDTWVLNPGDILYLPPGIAHHGVAVGAGCTTWSVGYRAPNRYDLLSAYIEDHADSALLKARFSDAGRALARHAGELDAPSRQALRGFLRTALLADDALLDRWLGQYLTEMPHPEQEVLLDDFTPAAVGKVLEGPLSRRSDLRLAFQRLDQGRAELFFAGEALPCSQALAEHLCAQWDFSANELSLYREAEDQALLHRLLKRQILLMA